MQIVGIGDREVPLVVCQTTAREDWGLHRLRQPAAPTGSRVCGRLPADLQDRRGKRGPSQDSMVH